MKKVLLYSMFLFAFIIAGCSSINYDHPLDSTVTTQNPEYFQDNTPQNDTADYWDPRSPIYKSNLDTTAPVLKLLAQNPTKIAYGDPNRIVDFLKSDKAYTVEDNRGKENVVVDVRGTDFSVIFANTNEIQYVARDKAGNSVTVPLTVIVLPEAFRDTIKPVISVSMKDIQMYQNEPFDQMKNVRAYDEPDGDITSKITVTGTVDITKPGVYTLTYKVKDNAGLEDILVRKITVLENTTHDEDFPVITLTGGDTIYIEETAEWKDPGFKAEDKTDGNITDKVQISGTVKTTPNTWYTITYTVSDKSMNITTKSRYVKRKGSGNVGDTTPPVISLKYQKDTLVTVIKGGTFRAPEVTILDNVDGTIPKDSMKVFGTVNTTTVGTYPVTFLVYDKAQNEGRLVIKVQVVNGIVDNTPPVITLKGKNPDTVSVSATVLYKDSGATVTDDIDKNLTATVKGSVDRTKEGSYTLTYTATDAAGNPATAVTRTVVVKQSSSSDLLEKYQVLSAPALPSVNKSYKSAVIEGDATAAPNLTAMNEYKINWDKGQKQIYDMSMNFTTINYVSLTGKVTHTLDKASPTMTFTGVTQVSKLDGEYYVVISETNLVFVKKDGSFAITMKP
jgi:hypothetical protein